MNTLRHPGTTKGSTIEQLARPSGVSLKAVSIYENTPPVRPGRKGMARLFRLHENSQVKLLTSTGRNGRSSGYSGIRNKVNDVKESSEIHPSTLQRLIDKETMELQHLMAGCAGPGNDHSAVMGSIDSQSGDIDALIRIRTRLYDGVS